MSLEQQALHALAHVHIPWQVTASLLHVVQFKMRVPTRTAPITTPKLVPVRVMRVMGEVPVPVPPPVPPLVRPLGLSSPGVTVRMEGAWYTHRPPTNVPAT